MKKKKQTTKMDIERNDFKRRRKEERKGLYECWGRSFFMTEYRKGFKELLKEGGRSLNECWEKTVFMAEYRNVF